jgi:hypothetical protein
MQSAQSPEPRSFSPVEIDSVVGDERYLLTHPWVSHVAPVRDGGLIVWVDDDPLDYPELTEKAPDRPADVQLHGPGAPCEALVAHPRAEHVQLFFDALGDPEHAPRGWWHARIWLAQPRLGPLLSWRADPLAS